MTVTIEISAELEARIAAEAKRRGLSKDEFVQSVLEERLSLEDRNGASELPVRPRVLASYLPIKDRSREHEWLEKHSDEYAGRYVALRDGSLIAQGDSYKEVAVKARELGISDALLVFVENNNSPPISEGLDNAIPTRLS